MSKIEIAKVAEVIKTEPDVTQDVLKRIIEKLNLASQPDDAEEKAPAVKKQFVVLVSDPEGKLPKDDFVAWVLQIPESESPATTTDCILRSVYYFNSTKKGQLHPIGTVGEAIEHLPAYITKDNDLWVKTRTPVLMLRTDNEIPKEAPNRVAA